MTIETEINRIKQNIADCYTTLTAKGATIPAVENVANLAACIRTIPASVAGNFITQSGDTIVTSTGTPLALDGISSLTIAPSITDTQLTFADDGNSTVSFSMQQLKDYVSPTPTVTTLHQYDRVDGKATVAGFWTDGNGQRFAVVVADAAYRSGSCMKWGVNSTDTILPNYTSSSAALAAGESGTYNTDTILNNYTPSSYSAFDFAHNALTVSVDNKTFESCLPNLNELNMLYQDRTTLDTYDTTLSDYTARSLSRFIFGTGVSNFGGAWSSNEYNSGYAWLITANGDPASYDGWGKGDTTHCGVCPVIEIPVDENGTVITN